MNNSETEQSTGIYIFLGAPFSGKETQTVPLSQELGISVFSMGALIRHAREENPEVEQAFQEFTLNGLHVPIEIKFNLLKEEMDKNPKGFILDNFPATKEDLDAFNNYIESNELQVNKVFYLNIGHDEMLRRFENSPNRGRHDDTMDALNTRSRVQAEEREVVLEYFRTLGKLIEINGENSVEEVSKAIRDNL